MESWDRGGWGLNCWTEYRAVVSEIKMGLIINLNGLTGAHFARDSMMIGLNEFADQNRHRAWEAETAIWRGPDRPVDTRRLTPIALCGQ